MGLAWTTEVRRRAGDVRALLPLVAGLLSVLAVVEVLVRSHDAGTLLLVSVLVGVATTAPVGALATHWLVPLTIISASLVALVVEPGLTVAGLIALVATFYYLGKQHSVGLVVAALVPFVGLALASLSSDRAADVANEDVSGPAATVDDVAPSESSPARDAAGTDLSPLLATGAALVAAGIGRQLSARSAAEESKAREATLAGELAVYSARGERARIARELHDVVAHEISSIAIRADTARLTLPNLSPETEHQLGAIAHSAREALAEMRGLLGVLRKDADDAPGRQPQPGMAELEQLLADARDLSGSTIRLIVSGEMAPMEPGVELTVYRVVQESLTNARRYAAGAPIDIELAYGDEAVVVRIRDVGPGSIYPSAGLGIVGMRERAAAVGGHLVAESGPYGFVVTATLPRVAAERAAMSIGGSGA